MRKKDYEIVEHTADVGIKVKADDLAGLFSKSADAMFDIIVEQITEKKQNINEEIKIELAADNIEELFAVWLSELLYLYSAKELVFGDFRVNKIDEKSVKAAVFGKDISGYKVKTEIKAVTYHELEVKKTGSGWQGKVIFDV